MANRNVAPAPTSGAYKPYVAPQASPPELTWSAVVVGSILGIIFSASSMYLVLKVGMTVSASIPIAVLSISLFRAFSAITRLRRATILENNMVQTTGSAGESIAFGVGVTMPALMLLGFEMDLFRTMTVAVLGGLLATTIGLRATLWIAGAGGSLSWLPVAFSPVRSLVRVPRHEPQVATGLEPGPVGGAVLGYEDEEVATPTGGAHADA